MILTHVPTGIEGQAAERRSQPDNARNALKRLRMNLALEVRDCDLRDAAPTELWHRRCPNGRIVVSPEHADFAPMIAEALEVVFDHAGNLHAAAEQLGCTFSQLIKFLKDEPRAWQRVCTWRGERGLPELV